MDGVDGKLLKEFHPPSKKKEELGSLQPYCGGNDITGEASEGVYELSLTRKWSGVPSFSFFKYLFVAFIDHNI